MATTVKTEIINSLLPADLMAFHKTQKDKILIIKFGATWCGPCKMIKPLVTSWVNHFTKLVDNIVFADIDVDEHLDLYVALKKYKMVNGLPTMLAYYGDAEKEPERWYLPDDSVIGGKESDVKAFLDRCAQKANSIKPYAYTYYT